MSLMDGQQRVIRSLRVSITDRCNFRCLYCMPKNPEWLPSAEILTFEEIVRLVRVAVGLGVRKVRITGGEPTVRRGCVDLVRMICSEPDLADVSLTTNGLLLDRLAQPLWEVGLRRINVSLDTLREEQFIHVTRREGFRQVWRGLEAAERAGFRPLKVNCVVMRGVNEDEIGGFARLAAERAIQIRFIEFMPLDGDGQWGPGKVVPAAEILDRIRESFSLEPIPTPSSDPARLYRIRGGKGEIGIIASVTEPFCAQCDRIRLTADGKVRTCLFSVAEHDAKLLLRSGAPDGELAQFFANCVRLKEPGHLINQPGFVKPARSMYAIGG